MERKTQPRRAVKLRRGSQLELVCSLTLVAACLPILAPFVSPLSFVGSRRGGNFQCWVLVGIPWKSEVLERVLARARARTLDVCGRMTGLGGRDNAIIRRQAALLPDLIPKLAQPWTSPSLVCQRAEA